MADFSLSFEGIEWAFVSGVYDSNYIISVRNVGYVRSAGRVLKEAFGQMGAAGGHASMAKAIIPLGTRNIKQMDRLVQEKFLQALHAGR
jgi:nanoRNase/pAp phosphatase (c-di-AMP/oligoRNAs hydrolase)